MSFFYLLSCKDIVIVHFNSRVLPDSFAEGRLGNTVFFTQLGLCFAVLVKGYEIFFEGYDKDLIENKDDVQYEFVNEGGKVVVHKK